MNDGGKREREIMGGGERERERMEERGRKRHEGKTTRFRSLRRGYQTNRIICHCNCDRRKTKFPISVQFTLISVKAHKKSEIESKCAICYAEPMA